MKLPLKTYTDKSPEMVMFLLGASITTLLKAGERNEAEAVFAAFKVFSGYAEPPLKESVDDKPERFEDFLRRMSTFIEVEPQSDSDTSFNAGPEDPDDAPPGPPKLNGRRGH